MSNSLAMQTENEQSTNTNNFKKVQHDDDDDDASEQHESSLIQTHTLPECLERESHWQFGTVCAFMEQFAEQLCDDTSYQFDPKMLQRALVCTQHSCALNGYKMHVHGIGMQPNCRCEQKHCLFLAETHAVLLRKVFDTTPGKLKAENFIKHLRDWFETTDVDTSDVHAQIEVLGSRHTDKENILQDEHYFQLSYQIKLVILRLLCDYAAVSQQLREDIVPDPKGNIRKNLQPFGEDDDGNKYYIFLKQNGAVHVYRDDLFEYDESAFISDYGEKVIAHLRNSKIEYAELPGPPGWKVLGTTLEELQDLATIWSTASHTPEMQQMLLKINDEIIPEALRRIKAADRKARRERSSEFQLLLAEQYTSTRLRNRRQVNYADVDGVTNGADDDLDYVDDESD